ncbi:hypothetical protein F4680DRAFT_471817 [Xylaria scruposa]|nr:hypothetical protein F4680DRAFT_471817 [Xylaria scruposa]
MDISDRIIYTGCWVVLMLYVFTTLIVFTKRSCIACAISFISACILLLDLAFFNTWFFLPAFRYHIREIDVHGEGIIGAFRVVLCSEAAWDVYLIILGSFGSWLAVFNAAGMLKTESCAAKNPHGHGRAARYLIKSVCRMSDYLGFGDDGATVLPITVTRKEESEKKSLFGVFKGTFGDRLKSSRHFQTTGETNSTKRAVVIWPGPGRSPGVIEEVEFGGSIEYLHIFE